jgi:hypothetical protein
MPLTNAVKRAISDHFFRTATYAKPTQLNIGLLSTLPASDGTGYVEISGNGYARVQRNPSDANWSQATDGVVANAAAITFPDPAGGGWGLLVGVGVWDQTGTLIRYASLTTPKIVNPDDPGPSFPIGSLQFAVV